MSAVHSGCEASGRQVELSGHLSAPESHRCIFEVRFFFFLRPLAASPASVKLLSTFNCGVTFAQELRDVEEVGYYFLRVSWTAAANANLT